MRIRCGTLALIALLPVWTACDGGGGTDPEPELVASAIVAVSGDQQNGVVAEALGSPLVVEVRDQNGAPLPGAAVSWSVTTGGGSVSVSSSTTNAQGQASVDWTLGTDVTSGQQAEARVSGAGAVTFSATAEPGPFAAVVISPDSVQLNAIGSTRALTAAATDEFGNAVTGVSLAWASLDPDRVTVDDAGTAEAADNGRARIVASAESGPADTAIVRVHQIAASVTFDPAEDSLDVQATLALSASAADSNGVDIADPDFDWSSSLAAVATVDEDGVVTGIAPGPVDVAADLDGASATTTLTVLATAPPSFAAISPAQLEPGSAATITGAGFSPVANANTVVIDSIPVEVTAATGGELQIQLPDRTEFPCRATGDASVAVAVPGATGGTNHPLAVAVRHDLGVGQAVNLFEAGDAHCNELGVTGGAYLVSVFNTSNAAGSISSLRLRGEAAGDGAALARRTGAARAPTALGPVSAPSLRRSGSDPAWTDRLASLRAHERIMDASYRLFDRVGPPARTARSGSGILAAPPPEAGDTVTIRIPDASTDDLCENFIEIQTRVVYSGERAVILEDVEAPLAGTMDDFFAQFGAEYDEVMHPVLESYFGDPLAFDEQTDDNGRIFMVYSEVVNDFENIAGFVFGGDFFPRSSCNQSNGAEVFYSRVPTDPGDGYRTGATRDNWLWRYRATVIHEVKHIVSFAERLAGNASTLEERWLEEASARLSEEFWARQVFGYDQFGNTDYQSSIHCEVRPETAACEGLPLVMIDHLAALYDYVAGPNTLSLLGPVRSGDFNYYGSGWSLLRWAIDQFAEDEAAFVQDLVQETQLSGIDNLEARTGRSFAELLGMWALSLATDDTGLSTSERLMHPSWNLDDIFRGLNRDYPNSFPDARPLGGFATGFGTFALDVDELRGGSTAFFLIEGDQSAEQLLELQSQAGGDPPLSLGLAIVRIQ